MTDEQHQTDRQRQWLSQLQDGELASVSASGLLEALREDGELRATWERYHLIGHAIRGERFDTAQRSVADRVRRSLLTEPIPIAAPSLPPQPQPQPIRHGRRASNKRPPLAGLALAAGVALLAIVVTPNVFQDAATFPNAPELDGNLASRDSPPLRSGVAAPTGRWRQDRSDPDPDPDLTPALASKLDRFLVTHQEVAPSARSEGMLHYATFVGY